MKTTIALLFTVFSLGTFASEKFEVTGKVITYYETEAHAESLMWARAFDICSRKEFSPIKVSDTRYERNNAITSATASFVCD